MYSLAKRSGDNPASSWRRSAGNCARMRSTPVLRRSRAKEAYDFPGSPFASCSERWTDDSTSSRNVLGPESTGFLREPLAPGRPPTSPPEGAPYATDVVADPVPEGITLAFIDIPDAGF